MIWFIIQLKPTRCFSKCQVSPKPKKNNIWYPGIRVSHPQHVLPEKHHFWNEKNPSNFRASTQVIPRLLWRWKNISPWKKIPVTENFFFRPKLHDFLFGAQNVSDTVTWYGSLTCLKVDAEFKPTRIHPLASWDEKGSHLMDTVRCVILSKTSRFSPPSGSENHPRFCAPEIFENKINYASKLGNTFIVHQAHLELQIDPCWDRIAPGRLGWVGVKHWLWLDVPGS